ncbi:DNA cytosine methyltransferase [Streptomyces cyaneofuscatus]|uniref:DNA cytosine methyltransferase n=1 Tax=Streptomyces cyaneofuscatus TaxID=66883 RepID=UPI003699E887
MKGQAIGLLAAGVPCPPFSLAGEQLGPADERNLFPDLPRLAAELRPSAVMVENVKGILQTKFADYRAEVIGALTQLGYTADWRLLRACDYGVPQLRPRAVLVTLRPEHFRRFPWPPPTSGPATAPAVAAFSTNPWLPTAGSWPRSGPKVRWPSHQRFAEAPANMAALLSGRPAPGRHGRG